MIMMYKGARGCGKTLTLVKDGFKFFLNGHRVLRNFDCSFGEYISSEEILHLDRNSEIRDCVIMIDEVQIFFDSRRSMRKENMDFSNFIQQIRKRHIHILGTTQYANTVDLRFRQHCDVIALPHFIKDLNVCEVIYIDVTSIEDLLENKQLKTVKIVYDPYPIFNLYDTEELITKPIEVKKNGK